MKAALEAVRSVWVRAVLARADRLFARGRDDDAWRALRRLSLQQLGELLLEVPDRFGALKAAMPEMPSEQIQKDWNGNSGRVLLAQTCAFVRSVENAFARLCRRPLREATILDYGCGWGRLMRLMCRFTGPGRIHGVDPWDASLEICRATRVQGHVARCDDVPRDLPFDGVRFDLVYSFSVFTHLSERTARAVMAAIRRRIQDDGLLALTIRPIEFWDTRPWLPEGTTADTMRIRHQRHGFAFVPQDRAPIDGEITFGETSISLDYIRSNWTEWELVGHETNDADPYQQVLFLRPR